MWTYNEGSAVSEDSPHRYSVVRISDNHRIGCAVQLVVLWLARIQCVLRDVSCYCVALSWMHVWKRHVTYSSVLTLLRYIYSRYGSADLVANILKKKKILNFCRSSLAFAVWVTYSAWSRVMLSVSTKLLLKWAGIIRRRWRAPFTQADDVGYISSLDVFVITKTSACMYRIVYRFAAWWIMLGTWHPIHGNNLGKWRTNHLVFWQVSWRSTVSCLIRYCNPHFLCIYLFPSFAPPLYSF